MCVFLFMAKNKSMGGVVGGKGGVEGEGGRGGGQHVHFGWGNKDFKFGGKTGTTQNNFGSNRDPPTPPPKLLADVFVHDYCFLALGQGRCQRTRSS